MGETFPVVRASVVQAALIPWDREATVEKACRLIGEAASGGAQFIVFPEAYIPAYPKGLTLGTKIGRHTPAGRRTWARYWANAVEIPGPVTEAIGRAAREAGARGHRDHRAGQRVQPGHSVLHTSLYRP